MPIFAADMLTLDKTPAIEQKLEFTDAFIREVFLLQNEISPMEKSDFPLFRAARTGLLRTRNDSTLSGQGASGIKNKKPTISL